MFSLDFSEGKSIIRDHKTERIESSEKWNLFLSLLAQRSAAQGGLVDLDTLMRYPIFYGRKQNRGDGPGVEKKLKTIRGEIGNYIRKLERDGFTIFSYQNKENGGWEINRAVCNAPNTVVPNPILAAHTSSLQEEAFEFSEPDDVLTSWLLLITKAKLLFWQGRMRPSYLNLIKALKLAESDLLKAATYAETARVAYRAEREASNELRDRTVEFLEGDQLRPMIKAIYEPRIQASYMFNRQSRSTAQERVKELEDLSRHFVQGVDISGLCRSFNISFITYQAAGDAKTASGASKAITATRAACVLSIAVGDPDLIQASAYNYALSMRIFGDTWETRQQQIELLVNNQDFCEALRIGDDSAQGPLTLASIYLDTGDLFRAKIALIRGCKIIRRTGSSLDSALFYSLAAAYALANGEPDVEAAEQKARSRYKRSKLLYELVERHDLAQSISKKLAFLNHDLK